MDVTYQLVPYSDALQQAYLDLLPEQEQAVARGKLEWKFRRPPSGPGAIAVARAGDEMLGLNGFMSARFKLGDETALGYQSMDTIVAPAARGQGVFAKLINTFYAATDGGLIYGFPNMNSSPAFFGKLGWSHFGAVPMLVRPLRLGYLRKRGMRFVPDLPLPLLARRSREAEVVDRFDSSADEAWRRFSRGIGCAVHRDQAFLNWRIADHPTEKYTILRGPGGFAVSSVADKHGGRIGYLMEAIGDDTRGLARLIAESLLRMRSAGADLAFAWCLPWSPNYRAYRRAGFYPFPLRLRPIVINFGARPLRSADPRIADPRSWYVSYLDSDTV